MPRVEKSPWSGFQGGSTGSNPVGDTTAAGRRLCRPRWGEAVGLRRQDVDLMRSRIHVTHTAVELRGEITLDNPPKTTRSVRSVPVARSVMLRVRAHLESFVGAGNSDLVFTTAAGGTLFRSFGQTVLRRAVLAAGFDDLTLSTQGVGREDRDQRRKACTPHAPPRFITRDPLPVHQSIHVWHRHPQQRGHLRNETIKVAVGRVLGQASGCAR